jgi:glutamate synthase (NADPH/NADH) small chain
VEVTSPSSVAFARCTAVNDDEGRVRPVLDESERMERRFDQLVLAVGQTVDPALARHLEEALGVEVPIPVDEQTLQVPGRPALFAGGDVIRGAGTVVEAVGDGRRAAQAIDRHLRGS